MQATLSKTQVVPMTKTQPAYGVRTLTLQTFSYESRKPVLTAVMDAMERCGCWLLERKAMSLSQTDFVFEVNGSAVMELYASLIGAGLELTRAGHLAMTNLYSVMKHGAGFLHGQRVVNVRLEVSFLDEVDVKPVMMPKAGLA